MENIEDVAMIHVCTERATVVLLGIYEEEEEEEERMVFSVLINDTKEQFLVEYNINKRKFDSAVVMDLDENDLSTVTGRTVEECMEDISGLMCYYLRNICEFLYLIDGDGSFYNL